MVCLIIKLEIVIKKFNFNYRIVESLYKKYNLKLKKYSISYFKNIYYPLHGCLI